MGLKGMNAIVTGGARGIGRAIALRLARDGANIGILDIQKETAAKTADEIGRLGVKAIAIPCDATDYKQVKESVVRIHKEYGSIDILINNAGIDMAGPFVDTDPSQWDKILNVNYRSFLIASHVCIPYMIENKRGNIVEHGLGCREDRCRGRGPLLRHQGGHHGQLKGAGQRTGKVQYQGESPFLPGRFILTFGISSTRVKRDRRSRKR